MRHLPPALGPGRPVLGLWTPEIFASGDDEVETLADPTGILRNCSRFVKAHTPSARRATEAAATRGPPPAGYQKVSTLAELPEFIPGLGALHVRVAVGHAELLH